jgi:hypothetical protein
MIVDCTMVAYERDAIDVRVAELSALVDMFHAVQGDVTFQGHPREPMDMPGQVIWQRISLPTDAAANGFVDEFWQGASGAVWAREKFLREASLTLAAWHVGEDAFFLVCDADEIPHPEAVRQAVDEYPVVGPRTLRMDYREWYANWRAPDSWQPPHAHTNQPVIGRLEDFKAMGGPHAARCSPLAKKWPYCDNVGWHLSNLGDPAWVSRKFGQFSHAAEVKDWDRNVHRLRTMRERQMDATARFQLETTQDVPAVMKKFPHLMG